MITSETVANVLFCAGQTKKVTRSDFETFFPKAAKKPTTFHNGVMRTVRRLADDGLLTRKNRGVYSITREGRTALKRFDSR